MTFCFQWVSKKLLEKKSERQRGSQTAVSKVWSSTLKRELLSYFIFIFYISTIFIQTYCYCPTANVAKHFIQSLHC